MATERNHKHILVPTPPLAAPYEPHGRKMDIPKPAAPNRGAHGKALATQLNVAVASSQARRAQAGARAVHGAVPGIYVEFEAQPGAPLDGQTLENAKLGIELVAFSQTMTTEDVPRRLERATVFVPDGAVGHFLERFAAYSNPIPKQKGERRYEAMLDPIAALRLATLRGLWTDAPEDYPDEKATFWWEVWLRRHDGKELERLLEFAMGQKVEVASRRLLFNDRIITLVRSSPAQLAASLDVLNDVAELRKAKETAAFFVSLTPSDQGEWVKDLQARTTPPPADAPAVCVLDTGVTRGHPLLQESLHADDCHTCNSAWGTHDHDGHGTEMAGLALYGDLTPVLEGARTIALRHRLESVKILPPEAHPPNPPELYGAVMAEAVSRVEIQAPTRRRTFSASVGATAERDRGQPTLWSAAVDALAAGRSFDGTTQGLTYLDDDERDCPRLFVLCAGNVERESLSLDHLDRSDTEPVHDPGQAWNALTVGAMTDKGVIYDTRWQDWNALASVGELSPWSTTGVTFADAWPVKPDVVFEGGKVVVNGDGNVDFPCADLSLLTTHFKPTQKAFVQSWATSAATAQAARLAALISAEYPTYWPETVRALVVRSAEWSAPMRAHLDSASGKRARVKLVQRYGFGVPNVERALRSANNALTLVAQTRIRPFAKGKLGEMHIFELPWPEDVLADLGATTVKLRVTLSYFIEPNPGRRGWKRRYGYASHGLRFDVKGPTESVQEFHKRLNKKALEEQEAKPATGTSSKWYLGDARNRGSIHSDILTCTAADLAQRGAIAVYPVSGWWKELPARDRSALGARYSLVVSIETPGIETDLWTPVAQSVGLLVEI